MPSAVCSITTFLAVMKSYFQAYNQEMDATINPALEKDHEDCCGFVLIPTEPWGVVAHSVPV